MAIGIDVVPTLMPVERRREARRADPSATPTPIAEKIQRVR